MRAGHLRAIFLPFGDRPVDLWVADGRITFQPQDGAEDIAPPGDYVLPGLVDCHVHLTMDFADYGLEPGSPEIVARAREDHLRSGTLLLRDIGTLNEDATLRLPCDDGLPPVRGAGHLLAPPGRYFGIERPTPASEVADVAAAQARNGARWVKLIGDWCVSGTDFSRTELNYPDAAIRAVVERAHGGGARVAVHATSRESIAQAVAAGVDSIEHGFGMDEALLAQMAVQGTAWTPTLFIEPAVVQMSASAGKDAARRVREGFEVTKAVAARAPALGVTVLAGTDMARPGSVWREVAALQRAGLGPREALAAASTTARAFLGEPSLDEGAAADLVTYEADPRNDPEILAQPALVMLGGQRVSLV